ncbi:cobalamin ABC transporter substrate-binding protein [Marinomonas ushuaiensis DSM 15871]|uniref:Cobalamin ABC transporter substrate-binding protein n=1 Tax=Marinomonas ushuaiensis DSM 15871 TaxID=1122207 RepID=X7E8P3_9GAMM|nr:ABC transporter substrate-binding protein [Marinomonas ushuaiensis]ETX12419.1 cobalamin ABC transporter substrate-binding protein [Marinomonas ushuaiensis DSM 15871]
MKTSILSRSLFTVSLLLSSYSVLADTFPVTVTDVAGRTITIDHEPKNIALSTGRVFPLLEMLYQDEAPDRLVAWRDDMRVSAPSMYRDYTKTYPQLKDVVKIGKVKSGEFDTERFINMKRRPDLFVLDISNVKLAADKGLIKKLDKLGIKVLAIDFREDPIVNTVQSVTSLATALGKKAQGEKFAAYYQKHVDVLSSTIALLPASQLNRKVFIERAAGYSDSCCNTFADGNMGAYVPFLNAVNIAHEPLKGANTGQMSKESIITYQPDVYIMQTTGWIDKEGNPTSGIPFGYAPLNNKAIQKSTEHIMNRPWLKALAAYKDQNIYSIYMPFYNSPYNIVALEYFAKWIYPEQFKTLNPENTFEEMNQIFANRSVSGRFGQDNFKVIKQ